MHFIATCTPVLIVWALKTSENVPSPNFFIKRYSIKSKDYLTIHLNINNFAPIDLFYFIYNLSICNFSENYFLSEAKNKYF
jgi:hypothetical protein